MAVFPFDFRLRRFGIALALYPARNDIATQVQRAPDDGGGDPDTGSAEIIDVVAPGTRTYVDLTGGKKHYRSRHISASGETSDWTHWVSKTATSIPSVLPNVPKLRDPSIAIDVVTSATAVTVTATIEDPDRRITSEPAFQVQDKDGDYGGSWLTSFDTSTGTFGTDGTLTRAEALAHSDRAIKVRVQWDDDGGVAQEEIREISLDPQNIIKSATPLWAPNGSCTPVLGDPKNVLALYVHLQIGPKVRSIHWAAASVTQSASDNINISADGVEFILQEFASSGCSRVWENDEEITITLTPYDDTGGDGGSGAAGRDVVVVADAPGETGSVGVRAALSAGGTKESQMLVPGAGITIDEDDEDNIRLSVEVPSTPSTLHLDVTSRATAGTGEDTLETITVPAGVLGTDGGVRLTCMFRRTGTAGNKTLKVKFGSTTLVNETFGNDGDLWLDFVLTNNADDAVQVAVARIASSNDTIRIYVASAAEDSSGALDIVITFECADAGDSVALRYSLAEYVNI
jgi:hypothetical protein